MRRARAFIILGVALSMLAACGYTRGDRTLSGAGLGAATGAVGSALVNGNPATGALIGGAAGAVAGALTGTDDIDLGKPLWR